MRATPRQSSPTEKGQGITIHDLPIGTGATGVRQESDSMGTIAVPAEHYWGAQTRRSLIHFAIGDDHLPKAVYHAYGYVKKAAALVNAAAGKLPKDKADLIVRVCDEVIAGKVNPTQEEAMVMVGIQVLGDDTAVAFAGSQGNLELNAMRPIIINNVLHSARILGDACEKLRRYGIEGITPDTKRIGNYVNDSLMLVTALSPVMGYDKASAIAHTAQDTGPACAMPPSRAAPSAPRSSTGLSSPSRWSGIRTRTLGSPDAPSGSRPW